MNPPIGKPITGWRDVLRIGAGIVMLVLGIIGLVLPVLQGILFLIVSAFLLAPYSVWVQRLLDKSKQRFPAVHRQADAFRQKFERKIKTNQDSR